MRRVNHVTETASVGLYSISVREPDVTTLLSWAARHTIPFLHLRGGERGYDLLTQDAGKLRRWRDASIATVPITGVTTDTDLADLLDQRHTPRRQATEDVRRLADAAHALGAGWVRLLARRPLGLVPDGGLDHVSTAVPLLVELHDPRWLTPGHHGALLRLLRAQPHLRLLADTAQLGRALARCGDRAEERLDQLGAWVDVLHLSGSGEGLADPGSERVADHIAGRVAGGQQVEVAVEWTGADRAPATALARYHDHSAWWHRRRVARSEAFS